MGPSNVRKRSFSLVELVIVVVILGIIAAIAVPRISRAARGAADAALWANLAALRNAIDLYAAEHGGAWPGADGKEDTLYDQLTKTTDAEGNVGSTAGEHIYGPYLRGGFPPVPVGPNIGATRAHRNTDSPPEVNEGKKDHGWVYNYETGEIIANTDDLDNNGVPYNKY